MKELTCFLVLIIMIFIYMNYVRKQLHLSLVQSSVNNRKYYVRNLKDKQEAADTLARLTQKLLSLLDSIKGKDKKGIDQLLDRFDPNNITENIPTESEKLYIRSDHQESIHPVVTIRYTC